MTKVAVLSMCDGCGQPADDTHIARRIQRLELATRFRPIHINILFLAEAPPPRMENYFYFPNAKRDERTGLSRVLFDELMRGLGISAEDALGDEPLLAEFQKQGYFFADGLECPVEEAFPELMVKAVTVSAPMLAHRYGAMIVKRVTLSYKPKHIILLSTRARHLIPVLEHAGLGRQLLLYQGLPLHFPHPDNPAAQAQFRVGLATILQRLPS